MSRRAWVSALIASAVLTLGAVVAFGVAAVRAALLVDALPGADAGLATTPELEAWQTLTFTAGIAFIGLAATSTVCAVGLYRATARRGHRPRV